MQVKANFCVLCINNAKIPLNIFMIKCDLLKCHFTGFEQSHEQSVATDSSSTVDQVEQETEPTSTESLVVSLDSADNDSEHESGVTATPVHLSEKHTEPIDGSGDDNVILLTLRTTPAHHLLGTSIFQKALDVEASSPQELETTVPESSTSSGINIIKEEMKQFEQERVEKASILPTTTTTQVTETRTISSKYNTALEDISGTETEAETENSSGGGSVVTDLPSPNFTPIIPFNSSDLLFLNTTEVNDTESISNNAHFDVKVTLIPDMTLTPVWDTITPPTPPQEFRADVEISGDTPLTTDDPDSSAESEHSAVPTTENPEETHSLTSYMATSYKEQDLTPTTESPNSKEEDELTTPTHNTTPPPTERILDRTGISGMSIRIKVFGFFSSI